jgi:hypothetical protein
MEMNEKKNEIWDTVPFTKNFIMFDQPILLRKNLELKRVFKYMKVILYLLVKNRTDDLKDGLREFYHLANVKCIIKIIWLLKILIFQFLKILFFNFFPKKIVYIQFSFYNKIYYHIEVSCWKKLHWL